MFAQLRKQLLILLAVRLRRGSEWVASLIHENEESLPAARDARSTESSFHSKSPPAHWLALVREYAPELLHPTVVQKAQENSVQVNTEQSQAQTLSTAASRTDDPGNNLLHRKTSKESHGSMSGKFPEKEVWPVSEDVAEQRQEHEPEIVSSHPSEATMPPPESRSGNSQTVERTESSNVQADSCPDVPPTRQKERPCNESPSGSAAAMGRDSSALREESCSCFPTVPKGVVVGKEAEMPPPVFAQRSPLFADDAVEPPDEEVEGRNMQQVLDHGQGRDQAPRRRKKRPQETGRDSGGSMADARLRPGPFPVSPSSRVDRHLLFNDFPSERNPFVETSRWPELPDEAAGTHPVEDQNDRWPELPEVFSEEETVADALWAVDHQVKLDLERRGDAWSALPF